jgi:hypothetical protein
MTKKKKSQNKDRVIKILPYFLCGLLIIGIAFFGSLNKQSSETSLSLDSFIAKDYEVSVDQLSELYVVADLSDALGLASASDVASNYVITTTMYDSGQTASSGKLEKPSITDVKLSRGIREYTVDVSGFNEPVYIKILIDKMNTNYNTEEIEVSAIRFE